MAYSWTVTWVTILVSYTSVLVNLNFVATLRTWQPTFLHTHAIARNMLRTKHSRKCNCICRESYNNLTEVVIEQPIAGENSDAICERKVDYVGAGTLGDIMSEHEEVEMVEEAISSKYIEHNKVHPDNISNPGLVTSTGGTLQRQFGSKIPKLTPLDRIALTANGNLQRIVSSFYDAPVHVHIDRCQRRIELENDRGAVWDRTVHLSVFGQVSFL